MTITTNRWLAAIALTLIAAAPALATIPYTPVPISSPALGPGVVAPSSVFGKEYSHDLDESTAGGGGLPDPEQVIAWDGSGGTTDSVDFSGAIPGIGSLQVDALANSADAYVQQLTEDRAHLVFSHDDEAVGYTFSGAPVPLPIPAGAPGVLLGNGNTIGGSGELSVETGALFTSPEDQSLWADQATINGMPLPRDVDGVELWGPEPPSSDANRFSAEGDYLTGVSVWTDSGLPYIDHPTIVAAVTSLLGPVTPSAELFFDDQEGTNTIDLDAMMVRDTFGDADVFDTDPTGGGGVGDQLLFSIRQIIDPADPDGYYATGSEIFLLDGLTGVSFLDHGGHTWDHAYTLGAMSFMEGGQVRGVIDINALEGIADTQIPEPMGATLLGGMFATMAVMRRRLG